MKGQCFCGAVKYSLKPDIQGAYLCHCRDCQYLSGSGYHALAIVDKNDFKIDAGIPTKFTHKTQDGSELTRSFCSICGTPLFNTSTRFDDIVMFTINSLDDPGMVSPTFQIWTSSKVSWADINLTLKSYPYGAMDSNEPP